MRPYRKHGEPALGEHLATKRTAGEHTRPDDSAGGLRIPPDAPFDLLLQGQVYYKVKKDNIPVIKQGKHLYIYRDELDKWLESSRKTPPAQSFEEENEALIASHRRKPEPKNW